MRRVVASVPISQATVARLVFNPDQPLEPVVMNEPATLHPTSSPFVTGLTSRRNMQTAIRRGGWSTATITRSYGDQRRQMGIVPPNLSNDPSKAKGNMGAGEEGAGMSEEGLNKVYGGRAQTAMRGMLGPAGQADGRESTAVPIPGKASAHGTKYTLDRSNTFDEWRHVCPDPVGWHMSKLGNATCKMGHDLSEAAESLQLQVIKGCNVIEIDGAANETHQTVSRSFAEAISAFELEREGFVVMARVGLIRQAPFQEEQGAVEVANATPIKNRIAPVFDRFKASSLPGMNLKSGFRLSELTDEQLGKLNLRRVDKHTAAAVSPDWIEASLINITFHTKIECIDVLLIEGLHTLFDGRPQSEIDGDLYAIFAFLEAQVKQGMIQYYGISSPTLAPALIRDHPALPKDAMLPDRFKKPPPPHEAMNLYRMLEIAQKAAGVGRTQSTPPPTEDGVAAPVVTPECHLRFVQYPFNLTTHQAISKPLPYDTNHTLLSLTRALGLTAVGYSPIEAKDLQDLPQRYHKFPMETDLKMLRMNFFSVAERCVLKEMDVVDTIQKGPSTLPSLQELFVGSLYVAVQRQLCNLYFFLDWTNYEVIPKFRRALVRLKEASSADVKEWANQYEQLALDLIRLRRRLFEHKHGAKAIEIDYAIDRLCPTLSKCPILSQKALNFATYGADVTNCGFHISRYFHEATELNPFANGQMKLTEEEIRKLTDSDEVSFRNYNPPHPYMYEPVTTQGKITGRKSNSHESLVQVDVKDPKFPDIPEQLDNVNSTGKPATGGNMP